MQRDFGNLFERLSISFSILGDMLMTPAEYAAVDKSTANV